MSKSRFVLSLALAVTVAVTGAFAGMNKGEESFSKMMESNKRFVTGNLATKDIGDARRKELTKGQAPAAIVVTCSDSRVAPEYIFDQGLGDIFVVRTAGNVIDPVALGSIEYAAEHLHTPLLILMGHEKCGAVAATMEAKGKPEGNIGEIIKKIMPAVKAAKAKGGSKDEILNNAIKENVEGSYKYAFAKSPILKHLIESGNLKVVTAVYHLASGEVEVLSQKTAAHADMHKHQHKTH